MNVETKSRCKNQIKMFRNIFAEDEFTELNSAQYFLSSIRLPNVEDIVGKKWIDLCDEYLYRKDVCFEIAKCAELYFDEDKEIIDDTGETKAHCVRKKIYVYHLPLSVSNCLASDSQFGEKGEQIFSVFYQYLFDVCRFVQKIILFSTVNIWNFVKTLQIKGMNVLTKPLELILINLITKKIQLFLNQIKIYFLNFIEARKMTMNKLRAFYNIFIDCDETDSVVNPFQYLLAKIALPPIGNFFPNNFVRCYRPGVSGYFPFEISFCAELKLDGEVAYVYYLSHDPSSYLSSEHHLIPEKAWNIQESLEKILEHGWSVFQWATIIDLDTLDPYREKISNNGKNVIFTSSFKKR